MLTLLSLVGFFIYGQEPEPKNPRKERQEEPIYDSVSDRILLRKEYAGGIILHSRGWGFQFRKGVHNLNLL